uniref:HAD family hydrolase n=1 Tax=Flavobacterium sp. TaxID=239 RepID=UPI0040473C27
MNLKYKKYDHISFDLWLTIIKSNPEFKSKRNQLFKDFFNIESSIVEVSQKIRYFDLLCNKINEKTGLNIDTFEIYYLILSSLDVNIEVIDTNVLTDFYLKTEELFLEYKPQLLFENIKELFEEIKNNGTTMNILSNTAFIKGTTLRKILNHYVIANG